MSAPESLRAGGGEVLFDDGEEEDVSEVKLAVVFQVLACCRYHIIGVGPRFYWASWLSAARWASVFMTARTALYTWWQMLRTIMSSTCWLEVPFTEQLHFLIDILIFHIWYDFCIFWTVHFLCVAPLLIIQISKYIITHKLDWIVFSEVLFYMLSNLVTF